MRLGLGGIGIVVAVVLLGPGPGIGMTHADPAPKCPPGMTLVPGGEFIMGAPDTFDDERPPHPVRVETFCLGTSEVTVGEYNACVAEKRCRPASTSADWPELIPGEKDAWSMYCNGDSPDKANHPINCVDWLRAEKYCRLHGWRLPTEEEFEYAARGGSEHRTYPWGAATPDHTRLNVCGTECAAAVTSIRGDWGPLFEEDDGFVGTAPVGSFPSGDGRWGHHDLSGNVWEWTSTLYCPYGKPDCSSDERIVRGSGFLQINMLKLRATRRNKDPDWHVGGDLGFRCATSLGRNPPAQATSISLTVTNQRPGTTGWAIMLVIALALTGMTGAVLGLIGGGGSILSVPIILYVVGLHARNASQLGYAVVGTTAFVSLIQHARAKRVRFGAGLRFGVAGVSLAYLGGRLSTSIPQAVLLAAFGLMMLLTARAMLRRRDAGDTPNAETKPNVLQLAWRFIRELGVGGGVGFLSGLLGVGGGFLIVPALTLLSGVPMAEAVGTSTMVIGMNAVAGYLGHRMGTALDWRLASAMCVAAAIGAVFGSSLTGRIPTARLRKIFAYLIVVVAFIVLSRYSVAAVMELLRTDTALPPMIREQHG